MKDTRKLEDQRDEHRVHLIVSQLICCPRRRKPVLTGAIAQPCQHIIEEKGWQILTLAIMPDHVHLFVRVWPGERASLVVKEIRGITARDLREEFPVALRKLPSLWTGSYFASTAGNVSSKTLKRSIEAQKGI